MAPTPARSSRFSAISALCLGLLTSGWLPAQGDTEAPPKPATELHGRLGKIQGFGALRLWGTPEQMGYAHGYLLGKRCAALLEADMAFLSNGKPQALDGMWRRALPAFSLAQEDMSELRAFLRGAADANGGNPPRLESLDRELQVGDLILYNSRDALRAFGCSGFTLWGDQAPGGELVTTRNFDYPVPGQIGVDAQLIIVRHPEGRRAVASVAFPGYIGAFSGINDAGVCAFMHDGTGKGHREPQKRYRPVSLEIRRMLEEVDADSAMAGAEGHLQKLGAYPFSYFVRVVVPHAEGGEQKPVEVFRLDADGLSRNPMQPGCSIVTNHYLKDLQDPAPTEGNWSHDRYRQLAAGLAGDKGPTTEAIWELMGLVATDYVENPTLHTLVVHPRARTLELAMATWRDKLIPAPASRRAVIPFDELFQAPVRAPAGAK